MGEQVEIKLLYPRRSWVERSARLASGITSSSKGVSMNSEEVKGKQLDRRPKQV